MKPLNKRARWGWHLAVVAIVTYELCTIEEAKVAINNWLCVFILVGLITTFFSLVFLGFKFGECISRTVIGAILRLSEQRQELRAQDRGGNNG